MTPTQTRAMVWNTYRFAAGMGTGVAEDDAFAAALAAHEAALTAWQDIETAPKDGEIVLIYDEGYIGKASFDSTGWIDHEADGHLIEPPPTHWMPLPAPPVVTP